MFELDKCIICHTKRADKETIDGIETYTNPKWHSALGLYIAEDILLDYAKNKPAIPMSILTICPKCRTTPLKEIYRKIIEHKRKQIHEYTNKAEKELKEL